MQNAQTTDHATETRNAETAARDARRYAAGVRIKYNAMKDDGNYASATLRDYMHEVTEADAEAERLERVAVEAKETERAALQAACKHSESHYPGNPCGPHCSGWEPTQVFRAFLGMAPAVSPWKKDGTLRIGSR